MQKVFHFAVAILVINCEVQAGNDFSSNAMAAAQIAVDRLLAASDEKMEVASLTYNKLAIYSANYYGAKCTMERKIPEPLPAGISFTALNDITEINRKSILYDSIKIATDKNTQHSDMDGHEEASDAEIDKYTFGFAVSANNGVKYLVTVAIQDAKAEDIFDCPDMSSRKLVMKPPQSGLVIPKAFPLLQWKRSVFPCVNAVKTQETDSPDSSAPKKGILTTANLKAKSHGNNTSSNSITPPKWMTASLDTAMEFVPRTPSNSATENPFKTLKKTKTIGNLANGNPRGQSFIRQSIESLPISSTNVEKI